MAHERLSVPRTDEEWLDWYSAALRRQNDRFDVMLTFLAELRESHPLLHKRFFVLHEQHEAANQLLDELGIKRG